MRSLEFLLVLAMLITFFVTSSSAVLTEEQDLRAKNVARILHGSGKPATPFHARSRMLQQTWQPTWRYGMITCDKYPKMCNYKGSYWPDCCKKWCTNLKMDWMNCGACGKRCNYGEMCCNGTCVNVWNNKKHCGYCNNECAQRDTCYYGMCSYA